MATTPFRAVNFQADETLTEDILDQLATNQVWLYDNTPRAVYTYGALRRNEGIRIVSGRQLIGATKKNNNSASVRFGNFFSSGCNPNITTGIVSAAQRKFFVTMTGIGTPYPDNRGFNLYVYLDAPAGKKQPRITRNIYIPWTAIGY